MKDPADESTADWVSGDCEQKIHFSTDTMKWHWWVRVLNATKAGTADQLSEAKNKAELAMERLCIQQENHERTAKVRTTKDP